MTLQFILGTNRKDHRATLIAEAMEWLAQEKRPSSIFPCT